jgi:molybdate transport system permease protein
LKVASFATLLALLLGGAVGFVLARREFPGRDLLDAVCTLPMVMPPTVLGYYLIVLIGRRGWLGEWMWENFGITLIFTWQGAVLASAVVAFPLVFKSARAAFEGVDHHLENARATGRLRWRIFLGRPLAWRGILWRCSPSPVRWGVRATLMVMSNIQGPDPLACVYDAVQAGQDDL